MPGEEGAFVDEVLDDGPERSAGRSQADSPRRERTTAELRAQPKKVRDDFSKTHSLTLAFAAFFQRYIREHGVNMSTATAPRGFFATFTGCSPTHGEFYIAPTNRSASLKAKARAVESLLSERTRASVPLRHANARDVLQTCLEHGSRQAGSLRTSLRYKKSLPNRATTLDLDIR